MAPDSGIGAAPAAAEVGDLLLFPPAPLFLRGGGVSATSTPDKTLFALLELPPDL